MQDVNRNMGIVWWVTSHSVRLVDVHVEVLDQILEGIHVPTVTDCMEGVHAYEVGIGQGLLKPFPLDIDALCDLFISYQKNEENRRKRG